MMNAIPRVDALAKPVIVPETINCDRGRVYLS